MGQVLHINLCPNSRMSECKSSWNDNVPHVRYDYFQTVLLYSSTYIINAQTSFYHWKWSVKNHTGWAGKYFMYQKTQNTARKPVCFIWEKSEVGKKRIEDEYKAWRKDEWTKGTIGHSAKERRHTHTHKRDARGQNWHITNVPGLLELRQEGFHSNLANGELCLQYCAFLPSCLFLFINSCH